MSRPERLFIPPHCPRSDCHYHACTSGWRWIRHGYYLRRCAPQWVQRFRCVHCGHTFSTQSFSTTYYLKRPDLLEPLFHRLLACSGYRQIARASRCHPTTIMGQTARLGRHALLYLATHRPAGPVAEALVIDGFESFEFSQYHPLHLNLAVGAESHFVYGLTDSEMRRKGRMTERQRRVRARIEARYGRPNPKAIERGIEELIRIAVPEPQALTIHSDEHKAYPRALRRLQGWSIEHRCTPSVAARTPRNPLFPVNLLDLLLRHNSANHKRETIAFSKRRQSAIERAAVLLLWRNYTKRFSERHGGGTPAMRLGMRQKPVSVRAILSERLFASRVHLPDRWQRYYRREIPTQRIANPRMHQLKLAF